MQLTVATVPLSRISLCPEEKEKQYIKQHVKTQDTSEMFIPRTQHFLWVIKSSLVSPEPGSMHCLRTWDLHEHVIELYKKNIEETAPRHDGSGVRCCNLLYLKASWFINTHVLLHLSSEHVCFPSIGQRKRFGILPVQTEGDRKLYCGKNKVWCCCVW